MNQEIITSGAKEWGKKIAHWAQDNMRVIVSIVIVVIIAGGIYSYSERTEKGSMKSKDRAVITEEAKDSTANQDNKTIKLIPPSEETETSFKETAVKGDSMTTLARRAVANYLKDNTSVSLSVAQKIYAEDYVRKQIAKQKIHSGTMLEFSKISVQSGVEKASQLTQNQLQNLQKYVVRVPSLS